MAVSYLTPGVYVEENLDPLIEPPANPLGTTLAAFVAPYPQGPDAATRVTSWQMFERLYGGFWGNRLLGPAIYSFFSNGGSECYVSRAMAQDAVAAQLTLQNQGFPGKERPPKPEPDRTSVEGELSWGIEAPASSRSKRTAKATAADYAVSEPPLEENITDEVPIHGVTAAQARALGYAGETEPPKDWEIEPVPPVDTLQITARSKGVSGNGLYVEVASRTGTNGRFDVVVRVGAAEDTGEVDADTNLPVMTYPSVAEQFLDVSLNPGDARYLPSVINSPRAGSSFVSVLHLTASEKFESPWDELAATEQPVQLTGGVDGVGKPDVLAALKRLTSVSESVGLNVNLVGETDSAVLNSAMRWAQDAAVFLVVDPPASPDGTKNEEDAADDLVDWVNTNRLDRSSYAAVYAPWLRMADPTSIVPGASRLVPPGGAVLGVYHQTDENTGPHKAPAGVRTGLNGLVDTQFRFAMASTDRLNDNHVNVIRPVPGAGICIMGARTLRDGYPDRYVSVRRTLIVLRRQLIDRTRWAIFEPNGPDLWERITVILDQYLMSLMQMGVLKGSTAETSYFVRCDASNNTPESSNAGRVNIDIGLALASPAEFIVIRIGQYEGGSDVEEAS